MMLLVRVAAEKPRDENPRGLKKQKATETGKRRMLAEERQQKSRGVTWQNLNPSLAALTHYAAASRASVIPSTSECLTSCQSYTSWNKYGRWVEKRGMTIGQEE